jgi:hypothetical protein
MGRLASAAVAAVCGAAAACLYIAVTLGSPGALILVYLTQLPLYVAGLWLGTGGAAIAGAAATLVLLASSDLLGAAMFAVLNAAPVALLVRQALLARQREDGALAWYPPGLLAAWLTGLALFGIVAALVAFGGAEGLRGALHGVVLNALDHMSERPLPNRDAVAAGLANLIPGIVAASWMVMSIVNAALAQGVLARFGANWRPSPHLAALALPLWVTGALGIAAAATVFPGTARFLGINTMIALFVPFCLAGLAVLHAAARRLSQPAMALAGFYSVSVLFGWPFLAVAVLGLLESWLGLRHRVAPQGVNFDG